MSYVSNGTAGKVTFRITNQTQQTVYFSGKFTVYIKPGNGQNAWGSDTKPANGTFGLECNLSDPSYIGDGNTHWWTNPFKLLPGEAKDFPMSSFVEWKGNAETQNTGAKKYSTPVGNYANGNWYFVSTDNQGFVASGGMGGIPAIKLGCCVKKDNGDLTDDPFLFNVSPVKASDSRLLVGKTYNLIIYKVHTEDKYWNRIYK